MSEVKPSPAGLVLGWVTGPGTLNFTSANSQIKFIRKQKKIKTLQVPINEMFSSTFIPSSETQGQIVGARGR